MAIPLDGYDTFIDDFAEFIVRMPDMMRYGRGTVDAEPISLHMSVDDQLLKSITRQIRAAAKWGSPAPHQVGGAGALSLGGTERQAVHADAPVTPFDGQRAGHQDDTALGRGTVRGPQWPCRG
jgi:hypothetical protein